MVLNGVFGLRIAVRILSVNYVKRVDFRPEIGSQGEISFTIHTSQESYQSASSHALCCIILRLFDVGIQYVDIDIETRQQTVCPNYK